ncbi:L,D-transpeptidase family protein [Lacticaseibacillus mingshuiensis]|uniref:L,D-transpeptidase family protein n=1 Tax=Lacticaseibacillus mingshuiensis TaxID=2799574 RepID=A0ABW4CJB3_9LACO|nr:L,D-transpeptidase family protein [Lacticaseibacillus mingshuiensis]
MKKKNIFIGIAAALVVVLAGAYAARSLHYQERFLPETKVLGVDIAGKNVAQANKALTTHFAKTTYRITENNKTLASATGSELGLKRDFTSTLTKLLDRQNPWGLTAVVLAGSDADGAAAIQADDATISDFVKTATTKLNATRSTTQDAEIVAKDDQYVIKKEVQGTKLNAEKLTAAFSKAIANDKKTVSATVAYEKPAVTSTSTSLTSELKKLTDLTNITGAIKIQNQTVTIPTATIRSWVTYQNGQIDVSQDKVAAYVATLATQYGTYGKTWTFKSTKRGTVTLANGTYGWSIAQNTQTANLIAAVKAAKDFTLDVATQGSGYHADGSAIGNTYVEVDLKNQHEYYYKDGKLLLQSDIVSGKPKQATPTGVWFVWSKQRNATLRGTNDDGTKYASPVDYWMPIDYTGVGLHDSPWQPKYGGDWYKEHGSHGCVNNPPSFMKKLYAAVSLGTPVIVY